MHTDDTGLRDESNRNVDKPSLVGRHAAWIENSCWRPHVPTTAPQERTFQDGHRHRGAEDLANSWHRANSKNRT